ncbi:hypothetical protein AX774_g5238 [Zancudomyces culisetae]|uniref:Uncharacterized protein n=1 Tax=Zancudomyces culisetae TaxID=1213189 RepID=A0A1R1PK49_ZANCU|nr:hypothetical protein AX774_g5238 [Zancudomyces culisetae]|eukprot:OMH81309.1 hypothetical protein AX774_g5238 [Zancudomyces culisetae]
MWQKLLLQYLSCIFNSLLSVHSHRCSSLSNKIQTDLAVLNYKRLLNRRLELFYHLAIIAIITYMLQNILGRYCPQRPEYHHYWNFAADIRNRRLDPFSSAPSTTPKLL